VGAEPQSTPPCVFEKEILIAHRGEDSIRVARAMREMGLGRRGIVTQDRARPPTSSRRLRLPPWSGDTLRELLNVEKILEIARASGVRGDPPGLGSLAENPHSRRCREGED